MKIIVNRQRCMGAGMCTSIAPQVFELDEKGVLVLREDVELTPALLDSVRDAIACCPVEALSINESAASVP